MTVRLFGRSVTWTAAANSIVRGELSDANGVKAKSIARADAAGLVSVGFQATVMDRDSSILPGDRIVLDDEEGRRATATVPNLSADVDADTNTATGKGTPGSPLELLSEISEGSGLRTRTSLATVTVQPNGTWSQNLAGLWNPVPGARGVAVQTAADGNRFEATFSPFHAELTLGTAVIRGWASLGTQLEFSLFSSSQATPFISATLPVRSNPRWELRLTPGTALSTGMRIIIKKTSPISTTAALDYRLADLTIDVDKEHRRVSGRALPNSRLLLEAAARPIGPQTKDVFRQELTTAPDGSYSATWADEAIQFIPGWQFAASMNELPTVTLRSTRSIRVVNVIVNQSFIEGLFGQVNTPITVTLFDSLGLQKSLLTGATGQTGYFAASPAYPGADKADLVRIAPGDRIEIELFGGDPDLQLVPILDVTPDSGNNMLIGSAPPGATLIVQIVGSASVALQADAGGQFATDFAGAVNLKGGDSGSVILHGRSGFEFIRNWTVPQLEHRLDTNLVSGSGEQGSAVTLEARSAAGRLLATGYGWTARTNTTDGISLPGKWNINLLDSTGREYRPKIGDQLVVSFDHRELLKADVPSLALLIDPLQNSIELYGPPNANIPIVLNLTSAAGRPGRSLNLRATTDESGHYLLRFQDLLKLRANDNAVAQLDASEQTMFLRRDVVAGFQLDLDSGTLAGIAEPWAALSVFLATSLGTRIASKSVVCDGDGNYQLDLLDSTKSLRTGLHVGDKLEIHFGPLTDTKTAIVVIPELEVNMDPVQKTVAGTARGTDSIRLIVRALFPGSQIEGLSSGILEVPVQADGTFIVPADEFVKRGAVEKRFKSGQAVSAAYQLPDGNIVTRSAALPVVNIEVGGARVCGFAAPGTGVTVNLKDRDTNSVAGSATLADRSGRFALVVRDNRGQATRIEPGMQLIVEGLREMEALHIPQFNVHADWVATTSRSLGAFTSIFGIGAPLAEIHFTAPLIECFAGDDDSRHEKATLSRLARADQRGGFGVRIDTIDRGKAVEAAYFEAGGQRYFAKAVRPFVQIFLGTTKIAGIATPMTGLSVDLESADGTRLAALSPRVGPFGQFDGSLVATDRPVVIQPGNRVRLKTPEETISIQAEPLSFDFNANDGLVGQAPANRRLRVHVALADHSALDFGLSTDIRGRFLFGVDQLPDNRNWKFSDWRTIQVALQTEDGNEIVVASGINGGPDPLRDEIVIYLPRVNRAVR